MTSIEFEKKTKNLIDELKSVCANYGLGNDGNEFKIITQIFLYKFINDKFIYETKLLSSKLAKAPDWLNEIERFSADEFEMLLIQMNPNTARLRPSQLISKLFQRQNEPKFAELFDI
jgi:type I restriction enzyme M protein